MWQVGAGGRAAGMQAGSPRDPPVYSLPDNCVWGEWRASGTCASGGCGARGDQERPVSGEPRQGRQ